MQIFFPPFLSKGKMTSFANFALLQLYHLLEHNLYYNESMHTLAAALHFYKASIVTGWPRLSSGMLHGSEAIVKLPSKRVMAFALHKLCRAP